MIPLCETAEQKKAALDLPVIVVVVTAVVSNDAVAVTVCVAV